jgi:hypothetical protein
LAALGAAAAAVVGSAAGAHLRPELAETDSARTLVVSQRPALADVVSYESSWHSVFVEEPAY